MASFHRTSFYAHDSDRKRHRGECRLRDVDFRGGRPSRGATGWTTGCSRNGSSLKQWTLKVLLISRRLLDGLLFVSLLFVSLSGFVSSVTNEYPLFIYTLCVLLRAKNCSTIVGCSKIPPYWIVPYNIYTILLAITLSLALWLAASKHHGASMEKSERCSPIFPTSQHESEPKMGIE